VIASEKRPDQINKKLSYRVSEIWELKSIKQYWLFKVTDNRSGADPEDVARGRVEAPGAEAPRSCRVERRRREDRGAEGAEGGGVWVGGPFPTEKGSAEVPPPQKMFRFSSSKR